MWSVPIELFPHVYSLPCAVQAFEEAFDPVMHPLERLSQMYNARLSTTRAATSSSTINAAALLPDDGLTGSLQGLPSLDKVTSTHVDTKKHQQHVSVSSPASMEGCQGGGERAASDGSGQAALNRDTMMHPTKQWADKCEHFIKVYNDILKVRGDWRCCCQCVVFSARPLGITSLLHVVYVNSEKHPAHRHGGSGPL